MKKGEFLFVYGTLRKGERADLSKQSRDFGVSFVCEDVINGDLYHLGGFPGLKIKGDDFSSSLPIVHGETFLINDVSIVSILDAYEGYDYEHPTQGLYNRSQVKSGEGLLVWVYTYNHPVTSDQRIESGDWKNPRIVPLRDLKIRI